MHTNRKSSGHYQHSGERKKKKPGAKVFNECEEVSRLLHHRDENGQKA